MPPSNSTTKRQRKKTPCAVCGKQLTSPYRRGDLRLCLSHTFEADWRAAGAPVELITEYYFAKPESRVRADYAYPPAGVLIELEGGTWHGKSRHNSPAGYADDCRKYNRAALRGFLVLRYTGDRFKSPADGKEVVLEIAAFIAAQMQRTP